METLIFLESLKRISELLTRVVAKFSDLAAAAATLTLLLHCCLVQQQQEQPAAESAGVRKATLMVD